VAPGRHRFWKVLSQVALDSTSNMALTFENLFEGVAFRIALPDHARCDVCNSIRNFGGWQPVQTLITHALLREECG